MEHIFRVARCAEKLRQLAVLSYSTPWFWDLRWRFSSWMAEWEPGHEARWNAPQLDQSYKERGTPTICFRQYSNTHYDICHVITKFIIVVVISRMHSSDRCLLCQLQASSCSRFYAISIQSFREVLRAKFPALEVQHPPSWSAPHPSVL